MSTTRSTTTPTGPFDEPPINTSALLGQAWEALGKKIIDGVQAAGHSIRMSHSLVFVHVELDGIRLTNLAAKANMTPQAMGELIDDLQRMDYVRRVPDPTDRRAKLILLTDDGMDVMRTAFETINRIESDLADLLGPRHLADLQRSLVKIIEAG
jgi:DNA-binding MarR family transcriptional regulator